MYNFSQEQIFLVFLIIGLGIGILFDLFRTFRKNFKVSDFVTLIQDIIFMAIVGIVIVNTLIIVNNGKIRFFIIFAVIFGITFYFLTIGKICFIIFNSFMKFFKKVLLFPFFVRNNLRKKKEF